MANTKQNKGRYNRERNVLTCSKCKFTAISKARFGRHMQTHTLYKCPLCEFTVANKLHFAMHLNGHKKEKREYTIIIEYKCEDCDYATKKKIRFIDHNKLHSGERPYKCNECYKGYSRKTRLKKHRKAHFKVKDLAQRIEVKGEKCYHIHTDKQIRQDELYNYIENELNLFSTKKHMDNHIKVEGKEQLDNNILQHKLPSLINKKVNDNQQNNYHKPLFCYECGFKSDSKKQLENHILVLQHNNNVPYVIHENVKENEPNNIHKPFSCSDCGLFCDNILHLFRHYIKHGYNQLFACTDCEFVSLIKYTVKKTHSYTF